MKKQLLMCAAILAVGFSVLAFTYGDKHPDHDTEAQKAVKELILKSYVNGAFNELNPDAMQSGFHSDFAIFSAKGEEISKYPISSWVESTTKRKNNPEYDASKNKWVHKFVSVDVTGGSAAVKIELSKDGKLVYTDYLSLLKFESGWKIVAKVYHKH